MKPLFYYPMFTYMVTLYLYLLMLKLQYQRSCLDLLSIPREFALNPYLWLTREGP